METSRVDGVKAPRHRGTPRSYDVTPLVGAAELQFYALPPVELEEVVGLQQHVVELQETQRLLST